MTPCKRFALAALTFISAAAAILLGHPSPHLIWNALASVPIGLYRLRPVRTFSPGELAFIMPPDPLAPSLPGRGHLPKGVPLLKRVAAVQEHSVCRRDTVVTVDCVTAASASAVDHIGRPPSCRYGCRVLREREIFVLNAPADSLDSRYFGASPISSVIGRAVLLWLMKKH